eukprot:PhF_6_TR29157/c0_g1_i2/m.42617/K07907/RAB12; Ras-related protein Rab-12
MEEEDRVIHTLCKSKHPTVRPMLVLSTASSNTLQIPFDAVRNVLSMTASLPKAIKCDPPLLEEESNKKKEVIRHICIAGNLGCGKTSFMKCFQNEEFPTEHVPTDCSYQPNIISALPKEGNAEIVTFELLDLSGHPGNKALVGAYAEDAKGVFLCYDVCNRESFNSLPSYMKLVKKFDPLLPVLLVGLKADLLGDESLSRRVVMEKEGEAFAKKQKGGIPFIECSAKDNYNIAEAFSILLELAIPYDKIVDARPPKVRSHDEDLDRICLM